jgi:hypothetical protein
VKKFLVVKCYVLFGELEASLHLKVLHLPAGTVGNEQMHCNFGAKMLEIFLFIFPIVSHQKTRPGSDSGAGFKPQH